MREHFDLSFAILIYRWLNWCAPRFLSRPSVGANRVPCFYVRSQTLFPHFRRLNGTRNTLSVTGPPFLFTNVLLSNVQPNVCTVIKFGSPKCSAHWLRVYFKKRCNLAVFCFSFLNCVRDSEWVFDFLRYYSGTVSTLNLWLNFLKLVCSVL